MRAAVYNRFWHSLGGGERHSAMLGYALARGGWKVDLVGHGQVDVELLSDRLAIDLNGIEMRTTPDRGDADLAALSQDYDLFVNATYMSRLTPRARQNLYLCYFPTPFDHDLSAWRRVLVRRIGPRLAQSPRGYEIATGWYPSEGGRRRSWMWSNGDGLIKVPAGTPLTVSADLGRPGGPEPVELRIIDETDQPLAVLNVSRQFEHVELDFGVADRRRELRFRSDVFVSGMRGDVRELGVAVSRLRVGGPPSLAQRITARFPWLLRDPLNVSFLDSYDAVLANSEYTRSWIKRLWHRDAEVLFPPIRPPDAPPAVQRDRIILTVGRFFPPKMGHSKRQLEMVQAFRRIAKSGQLPGWTFHLVGGCEPYNEPYLEEVRRAAVGLPVEFHVNAPRKELDELFTRASIFWSATGYGENTDDRPWAAEHFGMTTVEAMAGGCVPVVIDRAGQREIVRDDVEGYRWSSIDELIERTIAVAMDNEVRSRLSAAAVERAREFDDAAFERRVREIADHVGISMQ